MKNIDITKSDRKQLIKAQQGELDAVLLYKRLAKVIKETKYKETFLKIAADEGKHAGILKNYTMEKLKPKKTKAIVITRLYKIFGLNLTLNLLEKGELKAAKGYISLVDKFPNIKLIIEEEESHRSLIKDMVVK
ncbi:ferritin family protein [Dethiothermospora halolimnae]|uniref:ferritin family protein n=1 Tax=Dethiothermospora halolimnae TaxID=3114390 RepID=UPI003CCBD9DA